jgi:6-phosphogluconolactonase
VDPNPFMSYIVFVSCSASRQIHSFRMNPDSGEMTPIEVTQVPGEGDASRGNMPLAIARDRRTLHAELRGEPYPLSSFAIEPGSGRLKLVRTLSMPAPMAYIATSSDGRFLLSASYDHASLAVNAVDADGSVVGPSLQIVQTPPKAHCILQSPHDPIVYATSVTGNAILSFRFDEDSGRLAPADTHLLAQPHAGPRHLAFHPELDVLYCINEHAGSVTALAVRRPRGALEEIQSEAIVPADFSGNALAADIHVTPDGSLLYASVRKTNSISAFTIEPGSGLLKRAGTFTVEPSPRGFAIDPQGRFLICGSQESDSIGLYVIEGGSGALQFKARYRVGGRPSWIEVLPVCDRCVPW